MRVLLIDDDNDVREIIAFTLENEMECEVVEADSGKAGIEVLKNDQSFQMIVCDYNMPNGNGGTVYQYLLNEGLKIPYVFCSSDFAKDHSAFNDTSILLGEITKPQIFDGIQKVVAAFEEYQKENNQVPAEKKEDDFCRASFGLIENCPVFPCDIYLKVGEKPIKTFNQGDNLSQESLQKYKNKGVDYFLVKREDGRGFVDYISKRVLNILEDSKLSGEEKVISAHDVVMETIRELGISESVARATKSSVDFTLKFFDQNDEATNLKNFLFGSSSKGYLTRHSVGISYISVGILKQTSWDSPDNRNKMVMAGFMHDMSVRMPEFTESRFSDPDELINLGEHGAKTVTLLSHLKNIPEDVFKIIADHHERADGSGVPRGVTGAQLNPLTSVFIYSHDVIDAVMELLEQKKEVNLESVESLLSKFDYAQGKFPKIIEAFKEANLFQEV